VSLAEALDWGSNRPDSRGFPAAAVRCISGMIRGGGMTQADGAAGAACGMQSTRRRVLALASLVGFKAVAGSAIARAEPADERPQPGDHLVAVDAAEPVALTPGDIADAEIIAWPFDPATGTVRSGSRLNKVLLVRLDPATMIGATKERAAGAIVAYSAICPHAGCQVDGWSADEKILECPCHNSRYNPSDAAAVVAGPSTRALAALPLRVAGGKLTVAKPFIGRVGIVPA
jgi:rieske iron-sulfur protein